MNRDLESRFGCLRGMRCGDGVMFMDDNDTNYEDRHLSNSVQSILVGKNYQLTQYIFFIAMKIFAAQEQGLMS